MNEFVPCAIQALPIKRRTRQRFTEFDYNKINKALKMDKNDKIRHRAVIRYLCLNRLTPKEVHEDIEATFREDTPLYTMVKKLAGKF